MNAMTGDLMSSYSVDHMNPYVLTTSDLGMACEVAQSMGSYLLSFERVTDAPNLAAIGTLTSAATCTEEIARESELEYLRALHRGDVAGAKDARTRQKRANRTTAARYYAAFQRLEAHFGPVGTEKSKCPDFESKEEKVAFMLGLISGVQAVQHDRVVHGAVGVPTDVPRNAARATQCLNNDAWWGVPQALRAAVWLSVPGATPEGEDPWARLDESVAIGEKAGIRISFAIKAEAAAATGRPDVARETIAAFVAARKKTPAPGKWRLLDETAARQVEALSDRLWTEAKGYRTPDEALGTFWDEAEADSADDGDALFDEPEETGAGDAPANGGAPDQSKEEIQ